MRSTCLRNSHSASFPAIAALCAAAVLVPRAAAQWVDAPPNVYTLGRAGIGVTAPFHRLHVEETGINGRAIYAWARGSGFAIGVTGATNSPGGYGGLFTGPTYGMLGRADGTTGQTFGVWGESRAPLGVGVTGRGTSATGSPIGVFGSAPAASGYAGYFDGRGFFSQNVGVGTSAPLRRLHVRGEGLGLGTDDINFEDMVIEDTQAQLSLCSGNENNVSSAIHLREIAGTNTVNSWSILRERTGVGADLHFVFGQNLDPIANNFFMTITGGAGNVGIGTTAPTSRLHVVGTVSASVKAFLIDHPSDPLNKFLAHSCVESDEYKNMYDGVITTDVSGFATVALPAWFSDLNENFRYQLTIVDENQGAWELVRVIRKIDATNQFTIQTSGPGVEVSWQVTGTRKDAYARANPLIVEQPKPAEHRGTTLLSEANSSGRGVVQR